MDDGGAKTRLHDVWRTCNKIRAAVARININLFDYFKKFDPKNNILISEAKFINVMGQQLRGLIGLSEEEILELTDYFRVQDGRIAYDQFCKIIHENDPKYIKNDDLITGLEWEDPLHVNRLSVSESRRLCVLLTKISQMVRLRNLVIRPYFQEYEIVSGNNGVVTIAHFSRVLHFLGIVLSADDFKLLVKRFIKDSYTINYVAFVHEIEQIKSYLEKHQMMDFSEDVINNFPGRLLDAALPKLPRPEVGVIRIADVFGKETTFHSSIKRPKPDRQFEELLLRVQKHVLHNSVRLTDFFRPFDPVGTGFVTIAQFYRCLEGIGVSAIHRLYLSEKELETLTKMYCDENDPSRINWKRFEEEINKVFNVRELDKKPFVIVQCPPQAVIDLPRNGRENWNEQTPDIRELCDEALHKVKATIRKRRLYLEPFFRNYDRVRTGHVSRNQMRQVLLTQGVLLSDEELFSLEVRYNDDLGFNYSWFLDEGDPKEYAIPKFEEALQQRVLVNSPMKQCEPKNTEKDIVIVMAKIKGQAVRNRIKIAEFMRGYDTHKERVIKEADFRRSLDTANIHLTPTEADTLCHVFKSQQRRNCIEYAKFCELIEEAFYQPCLEQNPLKVPLLHFPSDDCRDNFLNFDERTMASKALQKLARKPDRIVNYSEIFDDQDRSRCGTVSHHQFLKALTMRGLHNTISPREFEVLVKCFGKERGYRMEFNYRAFLKALDLLYANREILPY